MKNKVIILIIFFIIFSFFFTYTSIEASSLCGSRHNWGSWSSISSTHHQRKCHTCNIKNTDLHSMQNNKCIVCKYANLSIKLNSTSKAYVGETIFVTTSISPSNSGTYTLTWSANGINHKLTPTSDKTGAWLRANKVGTILLTKLILLKFILWLTVMVVMLLSTEQKQLIN